MVNITIDGQKLQVPEGVTILEAARTANINIPLCAIMRTRKSNLFAVFVRLR